jgi:hypothetical protein
MLFFRGIVVVSAVISTQLNEEGNLPELTPYGPHVIKDCQDKILPSGL